jgi:hypothetical protein
VYQLHQANEALLVPGSRGLTPGQEKRLTEGTPRQLMAVAKTLMPELPTPGTVGTKTGLRSRATVDSATGIVWLVGRMDGHAQPFIGEDLRLLTWSFFNDGGPAQRGRVITPLIFKQEGEGYRLTGIGKTRTNDGRGLQTFEFELAKGTDSVGAGYFFGWHTGDLAGNHNAGVVEFEDNSRSTMAVLTMDGQLGDQRIEVGNTYRVQSQFPRRYSIRAVSGPNK